jgi:mono/diheme cytochrome c family protein
MMTVVRVLAVLLILFIASCTPKATKEVPSEFKSGQKVFHKVCSNCHGSDAMGGYTEAPRLIDAEYLQENFSDDEIFQTVTEGVNKMPSQRSKVSDDEIKEIIKFIRYSQKAAGLAVEDDEEDTLE